MRFKVNIVMALLMCNALPGFTQSPGIPDLFSEGYAIKRSMATQSGEQFFVFPEFCIEGSNYDKVFAPKLGNTLWSDNRRSHCYRISLLMAAQFPVLHNETDTRNYNKQLDLYATFLEQSSGFTGWLDARNTNFVKNVNSFDQLNNGVNSYLRSVNPKSSLGIKYEVRNLQAVSDVLKIAEISAIASDIAVAASVREALASDMAYSRLLFIEKILKDRSNSGRRVDPAVFSGMEEAKLTLLRDQDYYGALIQEISFRNAEFIGYTAEFAQAVVKKAVIKKLASGVYHLPGKVGIKAATTKASAVYGLWAWSLLATYETIIEILEQHEEMQIGITCATLSDLFNQELKAGALPDNDLTRCIRYHCDYGYFSQLVQITKGLFPWWHDQINSILFNEEEYKDARIYYSELKTRVEEAILPLSFFSTTNRQNNKHVVLGLILDSSGSMRESDPNSIRISASEKIIDLLDGQEFLYLIDFDDKARWLNKGNYRGWNGTQIKSLLQGIDSDGGTQIGLGLNSLHDALISTAGNDFKAGVLLLSDGKSEYNGEADWFHSQGIPVYTVSYRELADAYVLSTIANTTRGVYVQAKDEMDIVHAFQMFYNDLFGYNKYVSCSYNLAADQGNDLCSFCVDPGADELIGTLSWVTGLFDLHLISPGGLRYAIGSGIGKWQQGDSYSIVRIEKPQPGIWKAAAGSKGQQIENGPFIFEASGISAYDLRLEKQVNENQQFSYEIKETGSKIDLSGSKASVMVTTPLGRTLDMSSTWQNGMFSFKPQAGQGNYTFRIALDAADFSGNPVQRQYDFSEYLGDGTPSYTGSITAAEGNFLKSDIGRISGAYEGIKCFIYGTEPSGIYLKAIGMVSMVTENECHVEITEQISFDTLLQGDIIELDVIDWKNDK